MKKQIHLIKRQTTIFIGIALLTLMTVFQASAQSSITTSGTLVPISACLGTASSIQGFSVSGSGLSADIDVTPPAGYEVSTTLGSGYTSSVTLTQSGGLVSSTFIYVRLTSSATGTPSGNIVCTSAGATTQNVAITGSIITPPDVNQPSDQVVSNGNSTAAVTFTGGYPGTVYDWTNNTTSIGLAASGTGDIPSFTATNNNPTPVVATVNVTPSKSNILSSVPISLPNHTSPFSGNVRGFWFTAPTSFTMTSLFVPTDASTANQNIAVVKFDGNTPPPNFSTTTNAFTTLFLTQNNSTSGPISVNIQINAGEVIGLLASRGNVSSYGPTGLVTSIGGLPITLKRMGMQFPLSTNEPQNLWTENGGSISRVFFEYSLTPSVCSGLSKSFTITVSNLPTISTTGVLSAFTSCAGTTSAEQSFTVSGSSLTNDILVTPPTGYEVSTISGSGFASSVTLTQSGGSVSTTTIYVRLTNGASGTPSGNITCASTGATTQNVTTSGTVNTNPTATTSQTNVSCLDGTNGSLTVSVTGGTSPYSYNRGTGSQSGNSFTGLAATSYTVTVTDANGCTATTPSATITQPSSALSATTSQSNVSCNGGSNGVATVSPSGGTSPYTYLWNNNATTASITGIIAGSYSCVISDANGCQTTKNFTVTQPTAVSATTSQTNVSCNGGSNGSLTITATGGTSPYSYNRGTGNQLSNSFTGLTANSYIVTVTDANGCTGTTSSVSITQPTVLSGSTIQTNVSCNGGSNASITLTATGGTGTKTYLWSNAATTKDLIGLAFGTYTVTITDGNGCTANTSATITQPAAMSASINSQTNVACFGGSTGELIVGVTGGTSPYSYNRGTGSQSSNSFTGLAATSYTVTVTDNNGCTATTSSATITQPASLVSGSITGTNVSCNSGSNGSVNLTATGGTGILTYAWSNGATTEDISGIVAGNYTVTITDANGCTAQTFGTVTQPTAITATTSQTNVSCNAGSNGSASVTATGGTGTLAYAWSNAATTTSVSGVIAGTYIVTITDANTCSITRTITVTQPQTLVATQGTVSNVSCFGGSNGSLTVNVTGGTTPYSYDWTGTPTGEGTATASGLVIGNYSVNILDANGCSTSQNFTISQPTAISLSTSNQVNVSCNGGANGTVTVGVSGGTAPYSYDWTGTPSGDGTATITGLSATTYSVLVTDNLSCTATRIFTLTQPAVLTTTLSNVLNVSCNGGSDGRINTSTIGGTTPYSYNWTPGNPQGDGSPTINNLPAGDYTLTVQDALGCVSTLNQTVTEPTVLVSGFDAQTNVLCNGASTGTTSVIPASGGTAPYSYNWTPGNPQGDGTPIASNLSAGTYNCKITDSKGCFVDVPFTITESDAIVSTQSFDVCFGETVTVGTSVYTQSGTYTNVFEAQNGCDSTVTTNLIVRPLISSTLSFTLCSGQSVTVGTSTYNTTGTYTDTFTAIDGCDSVVTTSVLVNPTYNFNQTIQLCFGETLTVGATTYTASGNYTEIMQTVNGCDSTVNTNLTVIPLLASTQNVIVCFGETYAIGDSVYAQSGTYTNVFSGVSGCDSTVTTILTIRNENIVNQTISICAGETYSVGNNVYSQTGTYTNYFVTAEGCDSTHTLNLTVKSPVIVTTTLTDATIKANLGGATYQWINCSNNQAIAGATNQTYTATVDGDYAVIITYNGCTDTSACVTVENVSLTENPTFTFKLYPNPATSNLSIEASSIIETIELLDLSGKVIQSETVNANTHNFNVETLSRGMYLVRFTTNGEMVTKQFVKE